ncbi:MFS transporter [Oleiphilus messinensis]|nr:MFS transporter [Oleiphilus messinensis]
MLKLLSTKKLPTNHPLTYLFLAFMTMTGLSYINFLPALVNALAGDIGFDEAEAGQIVALNSYGGLLGSTLAIFMVRKFRWEPAMFLSLMALALIDVITISTGASGPGHYHLMLGMRFLAGVSGGLSLGIGFAVLARLQNPDRAFGTLLFVQFIIGSIVIYGLPALEAQLNVYAVFYVMVSFVMFSLACLPFLPPLHLNKQTSQQQANTRTSFFSTSGTNTLLLMLAIITYQIAASAIWAYVGLIGLNANINNDDVSTYIATTGLLGLFGAMLPIISGKLFGRLYWVVSGVTLSVVSALVLSFYQLTPRLYIGAMSLLFFAWPAVQSYLLAVTAELDASGKLSTVAAVISSIGLATGPLISSGLLREGDFSPMLYSSAALFILCAILLYKPVKTQDQLLRPTIRNTNFSAATNHFDQCTHLSGEMTK